MVLGSKVFLGIVIVLKRLGLCFSVSTNGYHMGRSIAFGSCAMYLDSCIK